MAVLSQPEFRRRRLPNGVLVRVTPMGHARSVAVNVASRVGSGFEALAEQGISHFVEHMVFKGTASRPSYADIATAIEGLGGSINGVTEPEMTLLWAKVAAPHFRTAVEVLADMVARPRFDAGEIDKERRVIQDELNLINDAPEETVRHSIRTRLWPRHGLGREIAGHPDNLRAFSEDQLRAHASRMFSGANLVISVAGQIEPADADAMLERAFGGLPAGHPAAWPATPAAIDVERVDVDNREGEQVYFTVAGRALPREDPDRYALDLACAILGEGMGSRLFTELRETRGLVYEVFSSLLTFRDTGALMIEASAAPDRLTEALQAVLRELGRLRRHGVSRSELARAREFVKGEILLSMEDTHAVAAWFAREELLESEQLTADEVVRKLDAVTRADIRRVAARVFAPDWAIVAASGPIDTDVPLPFSLDGRAVSAA
ncbi:MAG: insulinase family protein [Actinobacteria bacterium]|nr:insulinase family protein [Actinomycetota bacterium]